MPRKKNDENFWRPVARPRELISKNFSTGVSQLWVGKEDLTGGGSP